MDSQREPRRYAWQDWTYKATTIFGITTFGILTMTKSYKTMAILATGGVGLMALKWLANKAIKKCKNRTRTTISLPTKTSPSSQALVACESNVPTIDTRNPEGTQIPPLKTT